MWVENMKDCPYFSNLRQGLINPTHQRKEKVAEPCIPLYLIIQMWGFEERVRVR